MREPPRAASRRARRGLARALVAAAALAGLMACAPARAPDATAPGTPTQPETARSNQPARATRHMIAAANPLAAEAGLAILREGGSALDAAIAAQMVLNVVEPQSSGIGGGGFLVHFSEASGDIIAYDGRETAPAATAPDRFLDASGVPMKFIDAVVGGLSVGVPGLLRMLEAAHRDYGKLPWRRLFEPAIGLAENGFSISPRLHASIAADRHLDTFDEARTYFYTPVGEAKAAGATLVNRPFAETLRAIAEGGADAFYEGEIARDIVRTVRAAPRHPSDMTEDDLAAYEAKPRAPLCLPYRFWLVCGMPPPTSGAIATLQTLGILQEFDLGALKPDSARAVHLIAEASRLAFADRNTFVADSDFVSVPTAALLDPRYLVERAKAISPEKSMGRAVPGDVFAESSHGAVAEREKGASTTHLSVVDADGNALALTSSIEGPFGSRLMVRGFLLNNQLTDFSFVSERDGALVANRVEGGKRPRSSMSPTIVFDGSGRPVLVVGSPGGSRIIGYVVKTLIGVLDWGRNVQEAIAAAHFVNRNGATDLEAGTPIEALKPELEALGHEVTLRALTSGLHAIAITEDGLLGGADPRREGRALGD
ncbi:MAG: gamma-glutamyltransferase [Rhodospirillales bacterium]|nr:gamma-glutamyltransferase [Rhodospirillales bacterium]